MTGKSLKLIFLGTPQFAVPTLERCLEAGHQVLAVYTQPDRPKGRGQELAQSPVKQAALRHDLPVFQPQKIREASVVDELRNFEADAMIVVGYGQIIPQAIIDLPRLGIINVHASLLPEYRGAAPIQRAIADGKLRTGVTTMKIDAGLDTGDMLLKAETEINPHETSIELGERLSMLGADLLIETLAQLEARTLTPEKQNDDLSSYAPILRKDEGLIDWTLSAKEIYNRIRGFQPWPGGYTSFRDRILTVFRARPVDDVLIADPGCMISRQKKLFVACGHATTLELLEIQLEGRRRATAADFLNGQRIGENEVLGVRKN